MDLKSLVRSPISIRNNNLNFSKDISCKNAENTGGKMFNGIVIKKDKTNVINNAMCSGVNTVFPLKDYSIGTELDSACNCEIRTIVNGEVKCPENKFIKSYYSDLKKVTCCSPCIDSGNIKAINNNENCFPAFAQLDKNQKTELTCPENSLMRGFGITENTVRIDCCHPVLGGSYAVQQGIMGHRCADLGIQEKDCTQKEIDKYESYCKKYNVYKCNNDGIEEYTNKCNDYGFRYNVPSGDTENISSNYNCHNNLISELEKDCEKRDIKTCTVQNVNSIPYNIMNAIRRVMVNPFIWLSMIILLVILIIYMIYNNKKSKLVI